MSITGHFFASSRHLFQGRGANTIACLCWCYHQQKKQTNPPFLGLIKLKTPYPIPFRRISIISFFVLIQRKKPKKNQGKPDRSARFAELPALILEKKNPENKLAHHLNGGLARKFNMPPLFHLTPILSALYSVKCHFADFIFICYLLVS